MHNSNSTKILVILLYYSSLKVGQTFWVLHALGETKLEDFNTKSVIKNLCFRKYYAQSWNTVQKEIKFYQR